MEYYNFFDFHSLIQSIIYMLFDMGSVLCSSIKFLFTHFSAFIGTIPWVSIFKFIASLSSFLASCIAIYLFLLRYCPLFWKIVLHAVEGNASRWYGEQLFVVLENKSLASLTLKSIDLIIDNKYRLLVHDFKEPFILKPFETVKIGTGYIHSLYTNNGKEVSLIDFFDSEKNLLINIYSTSSKYSNLWTGKIKEKKDYFSYKQIDIIKHVFNGIPYDKDVLYAVQYLYNGKEKTLLVDKGGFCSDDINGINRFPQSVLASERMLKEFLEKQFTCIKYFGVTPLNSKGK